jgi:hypothetical protein
MKKSNKLLLGGFLTLLLFVTAIHLTLYAKYKSGDFTIFNADEDLAPLSLQQYPNILFVSVQNVPQAAVRFSDVAGVEKGKEGDLQFIQRGDTLQITGKGALQGFESSAKFFLPHNATLSAFNSSLSFIADKKMAQHNQTIYLKKSTAIFYGGEKSLQLGRLEVNASDSSFVLFRGNSQVAQLNVQLSNSTIEATEANFDQLAIATDSLSHIAMTTKQLLKASIRATTQK